MVVAGTGVPYRADDWPHGLACTECPHAFQEGERYKKYLYAFSDGIPVLRVVCDPCATELRSESGPSERRA
jgi:hypothetical protein